LNKASIRSIVLIWLGWSIVMLGFQYWIGARLELKRPDRVLSWTASETQSDSQKDKPNLIDPFMNEQVSWDSEYYLATAITGYDNRDVRGVPPDFSWGRNQRFCVPGKDKDCLALSYAFFPLYSLLTWIIAQPLRLLILSVIARTTLAAVIVSLLGTLGAMLALYSMSRESLGEDGGIRAAFYLLIFPSGFFLVQVYTEGLFLGLTFGALAFLLKRKWGWSALLAAFAAWTRPGGAILLLPMIIVWVTDRSWERDRKSAVASGLAALSPALSFGLWSLSPLAEKFYTVEQLFFGRRFLAVDQSLFQWEYAWRLLTGNNPQAMIYYALEFSAMALAVIACLLLLRKHPELALYGLAMIAFAFTSGAAQGMIRYVLTAPAIFLVLARWGKHPAFDKVWTLLSILLMGMEAILFSFDFWVA
jgi:hypothetical protein